MSIKVSSWTVAARQVNNTKKKLPAIFLHGYPNILCEFHDHFIKMVEVKMRVSHIFI